MHLKTRREFIAESAGAFLLATAHLQAQPSGSTMTEVEPDWDEIARSFSISRDYLSLNSAGASSLPRPVLASVEALVREAEGLPSWNIFRYGPRLEPIRQELARMFGCDPEELAIVRNATEALQTVLLGVPLKAGDEVLTTTLDYYAMLDALEQRQQREGIVIKKVRVPVPAKSQDELFQAFAEAVTERTKLILLSHPVNLTGQHFPVGRICDMAHARGIEIVVDAAQSFGQFEVTADSLRCDYMGASLHKWLLGPKGTGLLYVRRNKIEKVWPLVAAGAGAGRKPDDIRKYETIGTASMTVLALAEALKFHQALGTERIAARLKYLTRRWTDALRADERFEFHTSFAPDMSNGLATVHLKGSNSFTMFDRLFQREKILGFNVARRTQEFQGIRLSAGLFNTTEEIDRLVATMRRIADEMSPRA